MAEPATELVERDKKPPEMSQELQDPLYRVLSQGAPWASTVPTSSSDAAQVPVATLERVAEQLLRRFSFSGHGHSGSVRLEFAEGSFAGGALLVECDSGVLNLTMDMPGNPHAQALAERIRQRLTEKGLPIDHFEVNG